MGLNSFSAVRSIGINIVNAHMLCVYVRIDDMNEKLLVALELSAYACRCNKVPLGHQI